MSLYSAVIKPRFYIHFRHRLRCLPAATKTPILHGSIPSLPLVSFTHDTATAGSEAVLVAAGRNRPDKRMADITVSRGTLPDTDIVTGYRTPDRRHDSPPLSVSVTLHVSFTVRMRFTFPHARLEPVPSPVGGSRSGLGATPRPESVENLLAGFQRRETIHALA